MIARVPADSLGEPSPGGSRFDAPGVEQEVSPSATSGGGTSESLSALSNLFEHAQDIAGLIPKREALHQTKLWVLVTSALQRDADLIAAQRNVVLAAVALSQGALSGHVSTTSLAHLRAELLELEEVLR
jgi:hypothetical protein